MFSHLVENLVCSICGGESFTRHKVLWQELVVEWQLSEFEHQYVEWQQGYHCQSCSANLRIIALGNAIRSAVGFSPSICEAVATGALDKLRILDCNGAQGLSTALAPLPHYVRADYPKYDMQKLPFEDRSFDLVIHSDTLEHIERPVLALEECRRVIALEGHLCFTVPVIHGRMTRSRVGLQPSYHGAPGTDLSDFLVQSEFGADVWTFLHRAGFDSVAINHVAYPCATAITASMCRPVQRNHVI